MKENAIWPSSFRKCSSVLRLEGCSSLYLLFDGLMHILKQNEGVTSPIPLDPVTGNGSMCFFSLICCNAFLFWIVQYYFSPCAWDQPSQPGGTLWGNCAGSCKWDYWVVIVMGNILENTNLVTVLLLQMYVWSPLISLWCTENRCQSVPNWI